MPTSGPKDEAKWQKAKQEAAKSKDKSVSALKDADYALVMSIYKKMSPDYFKKKSAFFRHSIVRLAARYPEVRGAMTRLVSNSAVEEQ